MASKESLDSKQSKDETQQVDVCLREFICKSLNLEKLDNLQEALTNKILSKLLFMVNNVEFSDLIAMDYSEHQMLEKISNYLQTRGIVVSLICDSEKLKSRDREETTTFVTDVLAMVKVFNQNQFNYVLNLLDTEIKKYLDEWVKPSEEWLVEELKRIEMENFKESDEASNHIEEIMDVKRKLQDCEEEFQSLQLKNKELNKEIHNYQVNIYGYEERIKLMQEELIIKDKENIQLIDKFEEMAEELKVVQVENQHLRNAGSHYLMSEEKYENMIQEKDQKLNKYTREIEEKDNSLNILELQLKEFAKLVEAYKNEKEAFQKRKLVVGALQQNNHDKNEMLYYFSHKNHQLEVEKMKLDQYIKLCQYQIQKLTSEEKRLKHENHILKTMNDNLLELGGIAGEVVTVEVPVSAVGGKRGVRDKDSRKIIALLKENIKVSIQVNICLLYG